MKKKILHLIHGLTMGGAETLVKEYCLNLDKSRYDVSILCFYKYDTPYETLLENAGIPITYIDDYSNRKRNGKLKNLSALGRRIRFVKEYIQREHPDVIHSHLTLNGYVLLAKPDPGIKLVHTVHSEPKKLWNSKLSRRIDLYAAKRLVKKYHMQFITLHESMRVEVNELFGVTDSVVLNNGIDFRRFEQAASKETVRVREGIPQDAFVVGHVGRFTPAKNHKMLIEIFEKIAQKRENSFLLMVGNGALKQEMEQMLKDRKLEERSLILSNRTDIPDLLNAMDVFVFPSLHEGLGITLIEAQKMKLPCIISDTVPQSAVISNLVTAVSLKETPAFWAEKILQPVEKQVSYKDLEKWDMAYVAKELEKIYEFQRKEKHG